jgi:hypothetical protein
MNYIRAHLLRFLACAAFAAAAAGAVSPSAAEPALPDTVYVADVSRDTAGEPPKEWEHVLGKKQRVYGNYTVEYDQSGPGIHLRSNSAASWIEREVGSIDPAVYPLLEWEWMVSSFPKVEWERNKGEEDFAVRLEVVFFYRGSVWNPLNIMRRGLFQFLFRRNSPVYVFSYVWSVGVPVDTGFESTGSKNTMIIPVESGPFTVRRWLRERHDIRSDIKKYFPEEKHLVIKRIRILSDTDDSRSQAESGIRNIRFVKKEEK